MHADWAINMQIEMTAKNSPEVSSTAGGGARPGASSVFGGRAATDAVAGAVTNADVDDNGGGDGGEKSARALKTPKSPRREQRDKSELAEPDVPQIDRYVWLFLSLPVSALNIIFRPLGYRLLSNPSAHPMYLSTLLTKRAWMITD